MKQADHLGKMAGKVRTNQIYRRCLFFRQLFLHGSCTRDQIKRCVALIGDICECAPCPDIIDQAGKFGRGKVAIMTQKMNAFFDFCREQKQPRQAIMNKTQNSAMGYDRCRIIRQMGGQILKRQQVKRELFTVATVFFWRAI